MVVVGNDPGIWKALKSEQHLRGDISSCVNGLSHEGCCKILL